MGFCNVILVCSNIVPSRKGLITEASFYLKSLIEMLELPNFGHMAYLPYNLSHVIKFC